MIVEKQGFSTNGYAAAVVIVAVFIALLGMVGY